MVLTTSVVATVVSITASFCSDILKHRYGFICLGFTVSMIGYALLLNSKHVSVAVRYFALFLVTSGGYITQPTTLIWINNNMGGHYKRSVSSAMMVGLGNAGGIVASNVFITSQAPLYPTGYGTSLGLFAMTVIVSTVLVLGMRAENHKRDRGERDHRLAEPDADNLGDDHPSFRFTY